MFNAATRSTARSRSHAFPSRPRPTGLRRIAWLLTLLMTWQMALATPAGLIAQELARHKPPLPKVHDDPSWHTIDYRQSGKPTTVHPAKVNLHPSLTLLDGVGHLNRIVSPAETQGWKYELHLNNSTAARAARLNLWLGEYTLVHDQQPEQALWYFRMAQKRANKTDTTFGVAAQDIAVGQFFQGAYQQSTDTFAHLLKAKHGLPGIQQRDLSIWYGHAKACAGYHNERAELGIPEPPRLDPLCGAAALAKCLQAQGQPFDKATVLSSIHITGRGSSLRDVLDAAAKRGMKAKAVGADEQGLIALPKPLVAFVEHDHFICLTRADKKGVSYLCSDCGPWPGGRVDLTWKQWRKMDASVYAAIYKPGSELDTVLSQLATAKAETALSHSKSIGATAHSSGVHPVGFAQSALQRQSVLLAVLKAHLLLDVQETYLCGYGPGSARCPSFFCCPDDYCIPCHNNPDQGDPVNCASGEEEYTPEADLTVYNPIGPSVIWARRYDSLRGYDEVYEYDDLGTGWSHPFNVGVFDTNILLNWLIPQAGSGNIPALYSNANPPPDDYPTFPMSGILWNVDLNGSSIASATTPNGWSVALDTVNGHLVVRAPSTATIAENYDVRFATNVPAFSAAPYYTVFDIIPTSSVAQATDLSMNVSNGTYVTVGITGTDAPGTNLSWDILYNGSVIATSTAPQGWDVSFSPASTNDEGQPSGSGRLQVGAPTSATLGTGYEVRLKPGAVNGGGIGAIYSDGTGRGGMCAIALRETLGGSTVSGTFSIVSPNLQPTTGAKAVFLDNGARITITPSAIPSATQPRVPCTVAGGSPFMAEWDYDASSPMGHYLITFTDRTQWTTTTYSKVTYSGGAAYSLARITDRNTNHINFVYGGYGPSGFPLLNAINDSNGNALLVFNRAGDGTGNLTSVSDAGGRMIYYHVGTYAKQSPPPSAPPAQQELDHVSQYGTNLNNNPPDRYVYGYTNIPNGDPNEAIPFLTSMTTPSPTGTGTATATITYAANTCIVANRVDANGNMTTFRIVDANHTQVQTYNPQNQLVFARTYGFDSNMSTGTVTDGKLDNNGNNTEIVYSATYGDANDPYRPSEVIDGNGYAVGGAGNKGVWNYTWDQFGHCTTLTSPYETVTSYTWDYSNFALGELTGAQEGSKTPVTITYYEPSGLVQTLTGPVPGTTGGTQTESESYTYDNLGNVLTHTIPGNNAAATLTTTYSYTADGGYTQPAAIGQAVAVTDPLGHVSHFRYDSQGHPLSAWDALGNTVQMTYDVSENPIQIQYPATGQTGSGNITLQYSYLYVSGPVTQTALYDESGNLFRHVCPVFGKEGENLTEIGDVDPVQMSYDALYRVTTYTDGNGNPTQFSFNQAGYLSQIQYANGDTVQYPSYDANGNILTFVNGRNQTINYQYNDPVSMRTDILYPSAPALNVHVSYDAYSRPTGLSDGTGTKVFAYDDLSVVTSKTTTYTGLSSQPISYAFYPDGSRQSMTTPAGTYSINYDAAQRLTSLTNPSNQTSSWSWLNNDWLWSQTNSVSTSSVFTYNALGEVTDLSYFNSAHTLLSEYSGMTYDAAGNLTAMTSYLSGQSNYSGTTNYQYNNKDEVTQESSNRLGGYTYNYAWDLASNATTFRGVNRTFNSVNELSSNVYDTDGNATSWDGMTLTFDPESRTSSVGSQTFSYSGDERASSSNGTNSTYYLYSDGVPVTTLDSSGNVTSSNTYGAMGLLSSTNGSNGIWTLLDPFGNTGQTTGASGSLSTGSIYDLWGQRNSSASGSTDSPWICVGSSRGNYQDSGTGVVYPPTAPPSNPSSGTAPSRGPIGGGGGNGYTGGSNPDNDPDSPETGPHLDSNTRAGSEIKQGIIGDRAAAGHMARSLDNALTNIPGIGLVEGMFGQDAFGCPISGWDRVGRALMGAGPAMGAIGEATEGSSLASRSSRNVVLGTNEGEDGRNYLIPLLQKVARERNGAPNIVPYDVTETPEAFGRALDAAGNIHWDGQGLCNNNKVTMAEWDYIMQHRELWHKVIIHIWDNPGIPKNYVGR